MTIEEERVHWRRLINDLNKTLTVEQISEEVGVEPRQVWRWKSGEDRPKGFKAVRVYLLHVKLCPEGQRPEGHSAVA